MTLRGPLDPVSHDLHDALIERLIESVDDFPNSTWEAQRMACYLLGSEHPGAKAAIRTLATFGTGTAFRDNAFWPAMDRWLETSAVDRCLAHVVENDYLDAMAFLRPPVDRGGSVVETLVACAERRKERAEPLFGLYALAALWALRDVVPSEAARLLPTVQPLRWIERRVAAAWRAKLGLPGDEPPAATSDAFLPAWAHQLHPAITREPLGGAWWRVVMSAEPALRPGPLRAEFPGRWLIYGDIDRLLALNDRCGHLAGDVAISGVVQTMQEVVGDRVIRFGGDEFLILTDEPDGPALADLLRQRVADAAYPPLHHLEEPIRVTITFGVVPAAGAAEVVYHAADRALYAAKTQGRNLVVVGTGA